MYAYVNIYVCVCFTMLYKYTLIFGERYNSREREREAEVMIDIPQLGVIWDIWDPNGHAICGGLGNLEPGDYPTNDSPISPCCSACTSSPASPSSPHLPGMTL